jgi:hypothetical protein
MTLRLRASAAQHHQPGGTDRMREGWAYDEIARNEGLSGA